VWLYDSASGKHPSGRGLVRFEETRSEDYLVYHALVHELPVFLGIAGSRFSPRGALWQI
jgi:hypothetical protein